MPVKSFLPHLIGICELKQGLSPENVEIGVKLAFSVFYLLCFIIGLFLASVTLKLICIIDLFYLQL